MLKALVLSGGTGTRMRPLTGTIPKQLIPVANKPIIHYVMEQIASLGINDVGVIISPETGQAVKESLADGGRWNLNISYIVQDKPAGLAHAVLTARDYLGESSFLMYLGDNLISHSLGDMLDSFLRGGDDSVVLVKKVRDPGRFGVAVVNDNFKILRLVEKPERFVSSFALVGLYLFNKSIHKAIEEITPSARGELEITDAIQRLLEKGGNVSCSLVRGWWFDTGRKEDLLKANRVLLDERSERKVEGVIISGDSRVEGRVQIGQGSSIAGSVVIGPAVLGEGVEVINSYIGPFSSIGNNCLLNGVRLENTIVLNHSSLTDKLYITESLIGRHCHITGGAATVDMVRVNLGDWAEVRLSWV
ncbi:glucose-1-phosphate thymidylyltransferase [Desulfocucumis palustris]|uniref:Glucose-1-phosphate thymidylyltransferase n=2 Tax=Desulfocucumis palustris TaxID=1898651 RepID=A0A2L2XCM6_9FIRM|nr:glucose-1-phosphate thymidylyltransferase [Desulfocucumis palustris]